MACVPREPARRHWNLRLERLEPGKRAQRRTQTVTDPHRHRRRRHTARHTSYACPALPTHVTSKMSLPDKAGLTDDERILQVTTLPPPEHLIRFFPA